MSAEVDVMSRSNFSALPQGFYFHRDIPQALKDAAAATPSASSASADASASLEHLQVGPLIAQAALIFQNLGFLPPSSSSSIAGRRSQISHACNLPSTRPDVSETTILTPILRQWQSTRRRRAQQG